MQATVLAVLLMMLCSPQRALTVDMSLSSYFDELVLRAQRAERLANDSLQSSKQVQSELESMKSEAQNLRQQAETLRSDLATSRISQEEARQEAQRWLAKVARLETLLSEAGARSEQQASESAALILDRDGWQRRAERQGKLLRWAPWIAAALAGGGYVLGRIMR